MRSPKTSSCMDLSDLSMPRGRPSTRRVLILRWPRSGPRRRGRGLAQDEGEALQWSRNWERAFCLPRGAGGLSVYSATMIIHIAPNRSVTMPKLGEKKVLVNGIWTCPPSLSAVNVFFASASFFTVSDNPKP